MALFPFDVARDRKLSNLHSRSHFGWLYHNPVPDLALVGNQGNLNIKGEQSLYNRYRPNLDDKTASAMRKGRASTLKSRQFPGIEPENCLSLYSLHKREEVISQTALFGKP